MKARPGPVHIWTISLPGQRAAAAAPDRPLRLDPTGPRVSNITGQCRREWPSRRAQSRGRADQCGRRAVYWPGVSSYVPQGGGRPRGASCKWRRDVSWDYRSHFSRLYQRALAGTIQMCQPASCRAACRGVARATSSARAVMILAFSRQLRRRHLRASAPAAPSAPRAPAIWRLQSAGPRRAILAN